MTKNTYRWYDSPSTYTYDPSRGLYEQIWDIVDAKLHWYSDMLSWNEFYNYDKWKDLPLNLRYAKVTTITIPDIEHEIATVKAGEEENLFDLIMWKMPYFVWRDPNSGNSVRTYDETQKDEIRRNCECRRIVPCHERKWYDWNTFVLDGDSYNDFYVTVDGKKYDIMLERFNEFTFRRKELVLDLTGMCEGNDVLRKMCVFCSSDTLRDCSRMFAECRKLKHVDLSNCNLNWTTSLKEMFLNCVNLERIDLSNLDLNVNDPATTDMFTNCFSLKTIDVRNVGEPTLWMLRCILNDCGVHGVEFVK